jgi:hypothetical protein
MLRYIETAGRALSASEVIEGCSGYSRREQYAALEALVTRSKLQTEEREEPTGQARVLRTYRYYWLPGHADERLSRPIALRGHGARAVPR